MTNTVSVILCHTLHAVILYIKPFEPGREGALKNFCQNPNSSGTGNKLFGHNRNFRSSSKKLYKHDKVCQLKMIQIKTKTLLYRTKIENLNPD